MRSRSLTLPLLLVVLLCISGASLLLGAKPIPPAEVFTTLTGGAASRTTHEILFGLRLPRTVLALAVGLALGISGALMQAVSRNPMADPGLLGLNAGAGLAVALGVGFAGMGGPQEMMLLAFVGAGIAGTAVLLIGGRGASPLRLTLSGVALSAVIGGITSALLIRQPELFRLTLGWGAGSLVVSDWQFVAPTAAVSVLGAIAALCLVKPLEAMAMGDDMAQTMGVNVSANRIAALIIVTALSGAATAAAGPIGFLGLMVPHAVRLIWGTGVLRLMLGALFLGPVLMLMADILARIAFPRGELPVGLVTSAIGASVLIWLARRGTRVAQ